MNISSEQIQARVPVTILRLSGDVDGSNFQAVIQKAVELNRQGARDLVIDLAEVRYTSSAGLVALHNIAPLFNSMEMPDPEDGWRAIRMVGKAREAGIQTHVKLLNPQPRVAAVLEQTGLNAYFPIFTDQAAAVESF
jgi:anti-anti-sigma regulatory factor